MSRGQHIELFLVDGTAGGITTAEIIGWTGHVLAWPRPDLADVLKRPEAARNGVYLLLGESEDAVGGVRCYIGKTENFAARFSQHDRQKDFWNRAVLVTSKDDSFNEGHWGYLEARLIELATAAKRVSLDNQVSPQVKRLSEAQASDMESFVDRLQTVLPVLGVNAIRTRPVRPAVVAVADESPEFSLVQKKTGVDACAQVLNGSEFTMLAGSRVIAQWTGEGKAETTRRAYAGYRAMHEALIADGSIEIQGSVGVLTRDVPFNSPSTAGAVALGRSCHGRREWTWSGGMNATREDRGVND